MRVVQSQKGIWGVIDEFARNVEKEFLAVASNELWYSTYTIKDSMLAWYDAVVNRKVLVKEIMQKGIDVEKIAKIGMKAGWVQERNWIDYLASSNFKQVVIDGSKITSSVGIRDKTDVLIIFMTPAVSKGIIISDKNIAVNTTQYFEELWKNGEFFKDQFIEGMKKAMG